MKKFDFQYDSRLQIERPLLLVDYEEMSPSEQEQFEEHCQIICGKIPEKIKRFEQDYLSYFDQLSEADQDYRFEELIRNMNEISSCICDLNLLYLYIEGTYLGSSLHQ